MKFRTFKGLKNLKPKEQEPILKYLEEFRKQNTLNEVEVPEPEPIYRTMSVMKLIEVFECLKLASISLQTLTVTKSEQQQLDKNYEVASFLCYEKILKSVVSDSFTVSS